MKNEKCIAECYVKVFESLMDETKLDIEHIKKEIMFYKKLLNKKNEEEPLKIRKKKHTLWEEEKKYLEKKMINYQKELEKTYEDLDKLFIEQNRKQ